MNAILSTATFAVACFVVFLVFRLPGRRLLLGSGLAFTAYLAADDLATSLPSMLPALNLLGGKWNWDGKLFSVALSLIVIALFRIDRRTIGLRISGKNIRTSLIATAILVGLSLAIGFLFRPGAPNAETLAFQMTMPGVAEELAYRGIAPAILLGLLRGSDATSDGIPWATVLITGISFGIWHGIGFSDGSPSFDTMSALFPTIGGIAYGWLRFKNDSILLPLIAHSLGNIAFYGHTLFG